MMKESSGEWEMGSSMQSRWWFNHLSAIINLSARFVCMERCGEGHRGATRKRMTGQSCLLQRVMSTDGLSIEIYSDKDKWDTELIECIIPRAIENANREWNAINSIRWTSTEEWNSYGFVDRRRQQDEASCVSASVWNKHSKQGQAPPVALYILQYLFFALSFFFLIHPESNRDTDLKGGEMFR